MLSVPMWARYMSDLGASTAVEWPVGGTLFVM